MSRTTIAISIDSKTAKAVRAEAKKQNRPISWVAQDLLNRGLRHAATVANAATANVDVGA